MHPKDLHPGWRPVLRSSHRGRLRGLAQLRDGLLGLWQRLDVRQQSPVRGRDQLPDEGHLQPGRRPLLRNHRGRLRRLAQLRLELLGGGQRLGVRR